MNVKSKTKGEHNTVELVIEVDAKTFDDACNRVYNRQRKSINIPGFRKGKAPRKIIESMFGAGVFYEDAVNDTWESAYEEAIGQEKLAPVARPQVEMVDVGKEGYSFKAVVTLKPKVKLGEYKGLTAPRDEVTISESDVENELKPYIQRATRLVAVKRKSKKGDTAVIDFEGFDNGVPFEGGKGEGYSLELGSGSFVPGFEEGVIGMKAGEEKEIPLTFPQDYAPELAGKPVVFKVKVNEVKEPQKPELDDEFAKDVSEFDTLDELKKSLGDKLKERRENQAKSEYERAITDQLIDNMEVDLPEVMVDERTERMMQDYAMRIQSQGIKFEDYLGMMGLTVQGLQAEARIGARRQVLSELALEAVASAEKLKVTAAERKAELERLAKEYSMEVDQVKDAIPEEDLNHDLLLKKANELVLENAKVGKAPAKKAPAKKDADGEEKPAAKKPAAKKSTAKKDEGAGEKKPAAKKTTAKKSEAKAEE